MTAGMLVLNVTTNFQHMHNIVGMVDELTNGKGSPYLLFKTLPHFGKYLQVPPVIEDLVTAPWNRGGSSIPCLSTGPNRPNGTMKSVSSSQRRYEWEPTLTSN